MTRRQVAAEVCQITRDWMLLKDDPKDFSVRMVESEVNKHDLNELWGKLTGYIQKAEECL